MHHDVVTYLLFIVLH